MSTNPASVFQTGGGGYDFEHYVQSAFLTSMIIGNSIPVFANGKIIEISFQSRRNGYETDDLFLRISDSSDHRVIIQIKHNVVISEKNETFGQVVNSFWVDFNNEKLFDKENDKFFLIKSNLTNDDKNHIVVLSEWASTHHNEIQFYREVERIAIKRTKLEIFETLLKKSNNQRKPSKKEVWQFLKCFQLLSYDFGVQSSTSESHFLNLIRLSKSKNNSTKPFDIWNTIISKCAELNRTGGSLSLSSISDLDLDRFFDTSLIIDTYHSFKKLQDDGRLIIKSLKSTIGDYHINRAETKSKIVNSINGSKVSFITGSPGVGKSAILKEILEDELKNSSPFIFKADQFNKSSIAQVFNDLGVQENITDIFSTIALLSNKIIFIDSAEKLLEGDADNAFNQLLSFIEETNDLHLVLTSRSYAVNVISQKYGIKRETVKMVEIPHLSNVELEEVQNQFPVLEPLLKNEKIKNILRSPKYLDLTLSSLNKENFGSDKPKVSDFKSMLWKQIIENSTVVRNGLPRKRRKTFMHIALGRASSMQLFFNPDDHKIDYVALDELINDNVLIQNKTNDAFSPSHDILEDWALVKHIDLVHRNLPNKAEIFVKLGNQPALRRAFRLWVEEQLLEDTDSIINLVRKTRSNPNVEGYWVDEILTAIFRSENCDSFFQEYRNDLLDDHAQFLNRCILLIRTTCREYKSNSSNSEMLFPIGNGWQAILGFIESNLTKVQPINNSIINLLLDWEYKFLFAKNECSSKELSSACNILLHFIYEIENGNIKWRSHSDSYREEELTNMLWGFTSIANERIKELLLKVSGKTNEYGKLFGFDEKLIKSALSGVRNSELIRGLPSLLIDLANKHWKFTPPPPRNKGQHDMFDQVMDSPLTRDDMWGLKRYSHSFSPSGIYKTFVHKLLQIHPKEGIPFLVDFVNYITLSYKESEYGKSDNIRKIEINLSDGTKSIQYGNHVLWCAYRGITVTTYLLECFLMSFEAYLLELTEIDVEDNKLLKSIVDYCLKNSTSVSITSVIVSVFIAKPEPFEKSILPILKKREFYELDINRAIGESHTLEPYDFEISFAQEERGKFNRLPHRRKYLRGLIDFILSYQFNIGHINPELFKILDGFYDNCGDVDILLMLTPVLVMLTPL